MGLSPAYNPQIKPGPALISTDSSPHPHHQHTQHTNTSTDFTFISNQLAWSAFRLCPAPLGFLLALAFAFTPAKIANAPSRAMSKTQVSSQSCGTAKAGPWLNPAVLNQRQDIRAIRRLTKQYVKSTIQRYRRPESRELRAENES